MTDSTIDREEGQYDQRKIAGAMAFGSMFLAIMMVTVLSVGMVGAALGVGFGGFIAQFGQVDSTSNAEIVPGIGANPACENAPQVVAGISGTAEIYEYVAFHKDLPLPDAMESALDAAGSNEDMARITIISNNISQSNAVQAEGLDLRLSALAAENLSLGSGVQGAVDIGENAYNNASNNLTDSGNGDDAYANLDNAIGNRAGSAEFAIEADEIHITNGTAAAHQISFRNIDLPDVDMFVSIGNKSDFNGTLGPTQRVIDPGRRTCDALAEASGPENYNGTYP